MHYSIPEYVSQTDSALGYNALNMETTKGFMGFRHDGLMYQIKTRPYAEYRGKHFADNSGLRPQP